MKKQARKFENILEYLGRKHGLSTVFSDFLTLVICAFSLGRYEQEYLETINRYEKPEAYDISEALAALVIEMTGDGSGKVDVLGEFFEKHLSFGKNGQFFTPMNICDMMAQMINPVGFGKRICDCACGSGRNLMAAAKVNPYGLFYGADVDPNCAKMTVINMHLNHMYGEVAWMDTISQEYYAGWEIYPHPKGVPCIRKISEKESYIKLKLPESVTSVQKNGTAIGRNGTDIPKIETPELKNEKPKQGLLFEF